MAKIRISENRVSEILDYSPSGYYNPGGNENGKKDPSHSQAYLHGRKIVYTLQGQRNFDGTFNSHFENGTDVKVGETVVIGTGYNYYETRCISKTINHIRGGKTFESFYISYRFRNVKKDGDLGKKFYHAYSEKILLESEGSQEWGHILPYDCAGR